MTKKDYELIALTIAREVKPSLANYRMLSTPSHAPNFSQRQRQAKNLQVLWNLSLAMKDSLLYNWSGQGFDEEKFLNMCNASPQNWRYMEYIDGEWTNTFKSEQD